MGQTIENVTATPTVVTTPIRPLESNNQLAPPFDVTSSLHEKTGVLSITASVLIPSELTSSDVELQQYYDASNEKQLQFYFVYELAGDESGNFQQYNYSFDADTNDGSAGSIDLSSITDTFLLMCNDDPKTSRGTTSTVQKVSDV